MKTPAVTQAFLDLLRVQTAFKITAAIGTPIPAEVAADAAKKIEHASQVLQDTINTISRVVEHGATKGTRCD
jgi:hypothetical protein